MRNSRVQHTYLEESFPLHVNRDCIYRLIKPEHTATRISQETNYIVLCTEMNYGTRKASCISLQYRVCLGSNHIIRHLVKQGASAAHPLQFSRECSLQAVGILS